MTSSFRALASPWFRRPAWGVLALLAVAGCRNAGAKVEPPPTAPSEAPAPAPGTEERPLESGSQRQQEQARRLVASVSGAPIAERMDAAQRITALGEPGVQVLVESLADPDPRVREFAAWTLGYASDRRALPALRRVASDPVLLVSLEVAAARVRLGDDGGLVRLVQGLEDGDPRIRSKCILILQNRTGRTYEYLPDDPPSERAAAVERWRVFLKQRGLLG